MVSTADPYDKSRGVLPSDAAEPVSLFDRFATQVAGWTSKAWFFVACLAIVIIWVPTFVFLPIDTWQLIINTLTTIITFLLVALLQNTQTRSDRAIQQKLNAIADGLADLMRESANPDSRLNFDRQELLDAVGLEDRESTG